MGFLTLWEKIRIPTYDDPAHLQSGEVSFDETKCRQCGICVSICPGACIVTDNFEKMDYIKATAHGKSGLPRLVKTTNNAVSMCVGCYDCGAACPHGAIILKRGFTGGYRLKKLHQAPDLRYPKKY